MWAVEVYKNISTELLFTFLIINKTVLVFSIYRIVSIFNSDFNIFFESCNYFLIPVILVTIFFGTIFALLENNLHAFIALSSLPQTGYVLLGFLNADFETRIAALIYFILYMFTIALFYYALFFLRNSYTYMSDFTGLFYTNKVTCIIMLLILGSFSGIPPFGTFIAKFYLFNNLALTHSIWVVLFLLINSVISVIYYLRFAITLLTPCTKDFIISPRQNFLLTFELRIKKFTSHRYTYLYYNLKILMNVGFLIFLNLSINILYTYILNFFNI
jgi:NADH-quinone oxidoreductase subunit N